MERLTLKRIILDSEKTVGELWYKEEFICFTLEDPVREIKIKHKTAIPCGIYQVIINYSPKFKQNMPLLLNVPNFKGIRIHKGNLVSDSSGCPLVGMYLIDNKIYHSTIAYTKVFRLIQQLLKKGDLYIDVIEPEIKKKENAN